MFVLLGMERIGGWMRNCRVLVQEGVEFMLQEFDVEFRVGIVCSGEEIEMVVAVPSLEKGRTRRSGGGARGGRRMVWERRMGRGRVVYDI